VFRQERSDRPTRPAGPRGAPGPQGTPGLAGVEYVHKSNMAPVRSGALRSGAYGILAVCLNLIRDGGAAVGGKLIAWSPSPSVGLKRFVIA